MSNGASDVLVRAIDPHDAEQVESFVAFQRAHGTPRHDAAELRAWAPTMHAVLLLVAEDANDQLVGCGQASIMTPNDSSVLMVNLFAAPGRADVLRALLDRMLAWTEATKVRTVYCHVTNPPEHVDADLRVAGFRFGNVRSRVQRPITQADRDTIVPEFDGVTFTSMAERPDLEPQLLQVWNEGLRDVPGEMSFDDADPESLRQLLEAPSTGPIPERIRIAVSGDELVGVCALLPFHGTSRYGHRLTAVRRSHRGRGLARAMKLDAIRWAARNGASHLTASNDSDNAPMRAINEALGYETIASIAIYVRDR